MEVVNRLLNYKDLNIVQNTDWFNFSLDSVLLANFALQNKSYKNIMDFCTGNAPVPLILSRKVNCNITGVEIQKEVYDLATKTLEINNLTNRIKILNMDVKDLPKVYETDTFDLITCNPPFFKVKENSKLNESVIKTNARHETLINLEDIFSDIRKSVMKEMSNIGYKYVYSQAEGMWTPFSDSVKISKDSLLLADNGQGGFDVYNNKFKKTNQVLNVDPNSKIMIKRGQLLIYNSQCLQISKIDYTYGSFSKKIISSKEIRQYFPDVLIINVDNIGMSPVQVTKTTEKQSYMLISHAGSNFEGYTLNADVPIEQGELNNIFTINTTNTVNLEWMPTSGDGKQYYIVFVTNMPEQPKAQDTQQSPQAQTQTPATTLP